MALLPSWPAASPQAWEAVAAAQQQLTAAAAERTASVQPQLAKVLAASPSGWALTTSPR